MDSGGSTYNLKILLDTTMEKQHLVQIKRFYCYALAILYNLIFCENIKVFNDNIELSKMYDNLNNTTNDTGYIAEKLYYIYEKLYQDVFLEKLNKEDFYILIFLKSQLDMLKRTKVNDLAETIEINMSLSEKESIILEEIQKKHFQELIKIRNSTSFNGLLMIIKTSIIQTMQAIQSKISLDELFTMLSHLDTLSNKLYNSLDSFQAEQEKERLLNGDMSKEIEMQKQSVEYSNIQNGYEFEEYVANLYRKLGYTIEEVTKKSGDQGADVIAYKDNVKYVIQAKFYNNPVGNKAVQEVAGAIGMYKADKGIVVTNSTFTQSAVELANANNIELVDGEKIEKYKKNIVENIDHKEVSYAEELDIEHILDLWNIGISELEKMRGTEISGSDMITTLGIVLGREQKNRYDEEQIEKFLDLLPNYSNTNNLLQEMLEEVDMESIALFVKSGVFQSFLMNEFKESSQIADNGISDIDKYLIIYINNTQDIGTTEQAVALSKCIGLDIDDTVQLIREYKEKLSD